VDYRLRVQNAWIKGHLPQGAVAVLGMSVSHPTTGVAE
jgi:hypothetical protein